MPRTNKKEQPKCNPSTSAFFVCIRKGKKTLLKVVPNIDGREGNDGSPDISRGKFFDSTEKFIPLCHE